MMFLISAAQTDCGLWFFAAVRLVLTWPKSSKMITDIERFAFDF